MPWRRLCPFARRSICEARRSLRGSCGPRERDAFGNLPPPQARDPSGRSCGIRLANKCRASPGNRTLLHGVTARGLATSLATQSRREDSNPRSSTVGAWRSPLSYGESTLSTGIEPASPGRQPGRIPRRVRERETPRPHGPRVSRRRAEVGRGQQCGGTGHRLSGLSGASGRRSRAPPGGSGSRPGSRRAPSGIRTRVAGVRDRHPRSARRPGRGAATAGVEPASPG